MRTFYDILSINKDATHEEILEAYRKKVIEVHPDKGGNTIDFMNVRKAYEILSNPDMRTKYDKWIKKKELDINRDKWLFFIQSFLTNVCKNENLILIIITFLKSENNSFVYQYLNNTPSKIIAAEIIKKCLQSIRNTHPNLNLQCLELDSICNKIIIQAEPKTKVNNKNNNNKYIIIPLCCIIAWIVGLIFLFGLGNKNSTGKISNTNNTSIVSENTAPEWNCENKTMAQDNTLKDEEDSWQENQAKLSEEIEQINEIEQYEETIFHTGDCPYKTYYGKGKFNRNSLSELTLINKSERDAVVLLCSRGNNVIRNVFIKSGDTYKMKNIPNVECIIKVMYGHGWNKNKVNNQNSFKGGFMEDVSFSKTKWSDVFSFIPEKTANSYKYPTYTVTLHKVINGNLKSEYISEEDFFS